jgi:hypothetical protein
MKNLFLFFNLTTIVTTIYCQNVAVDTMEMALVKVNEKKYSEANNLLTYYNNNHSNKFSIQLQAQILFWLKNFKKSAQLYEYGITQYPNYYELKLDYARMLFQLNNIQKARKLFLEYLAQDEKNVEANLSVAWIDLYNGKFSLAQKRVQNIASNFPDNKEIRKVLLGINELTAPYVKLRVGYYKDDQPMHQSFIEPEIGVYKSWLLSPFVKTSLNQQSTTQSYTTTWFSTGNKLYLAASKTNVELAAGYFRSKNFQGEVTWKLLLNQKISNNFSLVAGTEKKQYQYTAASVETPFLYQLFEAGINFNKNNKWLGKAGIENQYFKNGNTVSSLYTWLLAPLVNKKGFNLKTGYSFSYAHSDKNTFIPEKTLTPPLIPSMTIEGKFDPYFTPNQQFVHAALISVNIPVSSSVNCTIRASVGFFARANQPVLFVDNNGTGPSFVNKTYYTLHYTPLEMFSELNFKLSNQFYLTSSYAYNSFIFFKSGVGNMHLKYLFKNGKRK